MRQAVLEERGDENPPIIFGHVVGEDIVCENVRLRRIEQCVEVVAGIEVQMLVERREDGEIRES
jgi:hypothetical protein